jgi:hypothetical protein
MVRSVSITFLYECSSSRNGKPALAGRRDDRAPARTFATIASGQWGRTKGLHYRQRIKWNSTSLFSLNTSIKGAALKRQTEQVFCNTNSVILQIFFSIFNPSIVFKNTFLFNGSKVSVFTDFSGILNFKTFSVAPSIINEKIKNVLFHWNNHSNGMFQ